MPTRAFSARIIRYYSYQKEDYQIITFLDEKLRMEKKKDYLKRIATHPETHIKAGFDEKLHSFGMLTVVYNVEKQEETKKTKTKNGKKTEASKSFEQFVYESYKQPFCSEIHFLPCK